MKTKLQIPFLLICVAFASVFSNCKKKDPAESVSVSVNPPSSSTTSSALLVIDNGARGMYVGKNIAYSARIVKSDGSSVAITSGITWSSSNANSGTFSGNIFTASSGENTIIKAKYTYEGVDLIAEAPLAIEVANTSIFAVLPTAIVYEAGGTLQMETVYIGSGSASYNFSSDNTSIATVSSSGLVTFVAAGKASIMVKATINGQESQVIVPVLVLGTPTVKLPVAKIIVSPVNYEMFKNETQQYTAKAYDSEGKDVTSTVTFNWAVSSKDADEPIPVTISSTGMVSSKNVGVAYVTASASGINGSTELTVNPDSVIILTPFYVSLGGFDPVTMQPNSDSQNLVAKTYKVDKAIYRAGQPNYLTQIQNPSNLTWFIPLTGVPAVDSFFDIVTLSNATTSGATISKKQSTTSAAGSTFVIAHSPGSGIEPGITAITVMP